MSSALLDLKLLQDLAVALIQQKWFQAGRYIILTMNHN